LGEYEVQQALAGLRVREALAGYTHGSFDAKSPWAVPSYVARQPTGVDGFGRYGFGADDCTPYATVKTQIKAALDDAINNVSMNDFVKNMVKNAADDLAGTITSKLQAAATQAQSLEVAVDKAATEAIKAVIGNIPGVSDVLNPFVSTTVTYLRERLVKISSICPAEKATICGQPREVTRAMGLQDAFVDNLCKAAAGDPTAFASKVLQMQQQGLLHLDPSQSAYTQQLLSTATMKTMKTPTTAAAVVPTALPAKSNAALLGIAALAALMLLK